MKDQDYIKIMDRISEKHIEEAVSWDASAQQNRRSIRRLSLGIGAIAASIAIVIGCIGYDAYRDHMFANSGGETGEITEDHRNIFGGHGELTPFLANDGSPLYRDDEYYYMLNSKWHCYDRWAINGSTALERIGNTETSFAEGGGSSSFTIEPDILTDGEQIYTYHDNGLFITDSYGNETAFLAAPWKPCKIQKLSDDWYFLSALIEDSWLDDKPQPYVLMNTKGDQINQFINYGNAQADSENLYFSDFEGNIYAAPLTNVTDSHAIVSFDDQELQEWTVQDGCIYSVSYPDVANDTAVLFRNYLQDTDDESQSAVPMRYVITEENTFFKSHLLGSNLWQFSADFDSDGWTFLNSCKLDNSGEADIFSVDTASLWDSAAADTMTDFTVFDTGDSVIFTLPAEGKNGEQLVQINTETYDYQYFGENYAPEQPMDDTQPEDAPAPETIPQEDNGFCSPDVFSLYYIPAEHMDSDNIQCYRMLPAVKASASQFNADVLGDSLPEGGGFRPMNSPVEGTDPLGIYEMKTTHYISYDEAREIIMNHDPTDTNSLFSAVDAAAGEYAGKYPYPALDRVCYEYWCKEDGSEFLVAMCGYAGEQETIEYVYFRYDPNAQQFAYEYLPARTRNHAPADADAETNALGGKGRIRMFHDRFSMNAEDDEYIYDLDNALRARKIGGDTVFESFSIPAVPEYNADNQQTRILFATEGMILTVKDRTLYELHADGNLTAVFTLTEDNEGNPVNKVVFNEIHGFAYDASGRPTKLFLRGSASIAGIAPEDGGYWIYAVLNLKTGTYTDLKCSSHPIEFAVTEDDVYMAGYLIDEPQGSIDDDRNREANYQAGYHLVRFDDDGNPIRVDTDEWHFGSLDGCYFDDEGYVWFGSCKHNIHDGSVIEVSKEEYSKAYSNVRGTHSYIYKENDPQRICLSNPDDTEPVILKEGNDNPQQTYFNDGAYCENGSIHIAVIEYEDVETSRKPISLIIYTVDGDQVTSYKCSYPT